jgi:small GTP-binding protein
MAGVFDFIFRVKVFGDPGVGKSSLMDKYTIPVNSDRSQLTSGIDSYVKYLEINKKKIKLEISVLTGDVHFKFLLSKYFKSTEGAIFMYDITDYSTLASMDKWIQIARKELPPESPIIVAGNKADLRSSRKVTSEQCIEFAKKNSLNGFVECSSKTGQNTEEIFRMLSKLMVKRDIIKYYL